MELFLNILWLVIATLGLFVWRVHWNPQRGDRGHAPWRQWTAFASALVLLFFMVSLTDDLHSELVYFEECAASRRHTACLACPHDLPQKHVTGAAYAAGIIPKFSQPLSRTGSLTQQAESWPSRPRFAVAADRAPPLIAL